MASVPTLTDGTVTLRAHREQDVDGVVEQHVDPLTRRWTAVPLDYGTDDARRFVRHAMPGGWATGHEWAFALEVAGGYGGTVSLRHLDHGRAELAYGAHPRARGTGAMTRGLGLLLDWGFAERDLHTVSWWAHRGNWASRRTAWRLGFDLEGTVRRWLPQREELVDAWVATLLRDDPRSPRTTWLDTPVLTGDGVTLRPLRDTDVPRIVEACADERTAYWLGQMPSPYAVSDAIAWLETTLENAAAGRTVTWAVAEPRTDALLGAINLFDLGAGPVGEIGYWAHAEARGRGLMTAACRRVVRHAFDDLGLELVRAVAAVDNAASRHVIEQTGMSLWGVERAGTRIRTGLADAARYDLSAADVS